MIIHKKNFAFEIWKLVLKQDLAQSTMAPLMAFCRARQDYVQADS